MRILLDCRPLQSAGRGAEKSRIIFSAAAELSVSEGVEWLVLADHRYRPGQFPVLPGKVIIRRALPGKVGWKLWYDCQLPRVLERHWVERVWLTGGVACRVAAPVHLWMPERVNPGEWLRSEMPLYRGRLKAGLAGVEAVICYSERDRVWLEGMRPELKGRIRVLTVHADESIRVMPEAERERVKAGLTQGREYFLADISGCGEEEMVNLLKAFSLFKRRQRSQMRLVLAGESGMQRQMGERLKTYKYREDVDWRADRADVGPAACAPGSGSDAGAAYRGAAYAVMLPVEGNSLGTTMLNTWKAGVPVIVPAGGLLAEMAQGAALGMNPGDPASLAGQLMRIYKEEDIRRQLIGKGFERLIVYSRENFLQMLQVITEIAAC